MCTSVKALYRQSRVLNVLAKKKVFSAFIRTNLNYCPLVWINRNKTDLARKGTGKDSPVDLK